MQRDAHGTPDEEPPDLQVICAWCRARIGSLEGLDRPDREITHGICSDCLRKVLQEIGSPLIPPDPPRHDSP
jgi:hypothetical protein